MWNLSFKNDFLPLKKSVFGFWRKTLKQIFFFMFRLWFSYKNHRRTNFLLGGIFENAQQILFIENAILAIFNAFSKIMTKTTFVRLLFLKLKQ